MTETDEQCSPLQKIALPHHTAIQQQKPLTPGEVAAKPTERVYSYPKCGRSKLLPYEFVRSHIVRLCASPCVILSVANVPVAHCAVERDKTCNKLLVLASKMR